MPDDVKNPPDYPKHGSFGDLLEWHIKRGTHSKCRRDKKGKKWAIGEFANQIRIGNEDVESTVRKLYNWRKNIDLPDSDEEVRSICLLLFNGEPHLEDWEEDLWAAFTRDRQRKGRAGGGIILQSLPFAHHQFHKFKTEPSNLIELLRTDVRATSLVGRETELAMLGAWLSEPQGISVKCIIGGAGAGKTRLAIEACEQAEADGWFATFLPSSELQTLQDRRGLIGWTPSQPTLIVIDYAATSLTALKRWFDELASLRLRSGLKLRILLLERLADREHGWWAELIRPGSNNHASSADLIGTQLPYALPSLDAAQSLRALFGEVMAKAAPLFDPPRAEITQPLPDKNNWLDLRSSNNSADNEPLYVMMAGICAVESDVPTALSMNRLGLAFRLVSIEEERLKKFAIARGLADGGKLLRHIAGCITLQNGCALENLPALVGEERAALNITAPLDDEVIAEIVCDFLPTRSTVEPIRPDLIGEMFCLRAIEGGRFRGITERYAITQRCWQRKPLDTAYTLILCARDLAGGDSSHASVAYLNFLVDVESDPNLLIQVTPYIPSTAVALQEFRRKIYGKIVDRLSRHEGPDADANSHYLVLYLGYLSASNHSFGQYQPALEMIEKSVALNRKNLISRPVNGSPSLARALTDNANILRILGRYEEAIEAVEEAIEHYQAVLARKVSAFLPYHADAIQILGLCFNDLERHDDAIRVTEEALLIRRDLASLYDGAIGPLAASLMHMGFIASNGQCYEEALMYTVEAEEIYRNLLVNRPNTYNSRLAMVLHNRAEILNSLDRYEEALPPAQESVKIQRQQLSLQPKSSSEELARSLNILARCLKNLCRCNEALAVAHDALAHWRRSAAMRPGMFDSSLALSLKDLSIILMAMGLQSEALVAEEEAMAIYRSLKGKTEPL